MKIINGYFAGWKILLQNKKMWLWLYAIQCLIALLAALPFAGYLGRTIGNSLDLGNSLGRFDYTFLNDIIMNYGRSILAIFQQSLGFIILYFLTAVFLMGGILAVIKNWKDHSFPNTFWQGASHFFWRILRLSFYFMLPQLLALGVMAGIFLKVTNNMSPFELEDELIIINAVKFLLPIYLFIASFLFMVHDLAKVILIHRDETWLTKTIRESYKLAFIKFRKYYPYYFLTILVFIFLTLIYYVVNELLSPTTLGQVALFFLIGQLYLFLRVGLKVATLGGLNELYQIDFEGNKSNTQEI